MSIGGLEGGLIVGRSRLDVVDVVGTGLAVEEAALLDGAAAWRAPWWWGAGAGGGGDR